MNDRMQVSVPKLGIFTAAPVPTTPVLLDSGTSTIGI
jgi:hypothetical protein